MTTKTLTSSLKVKTRVKAISDAVIEATPVAVEEVDSVEEEAIVVVEEVDSVEEEAIVAVEEAEAVEVETPVAEAVEEAASVVEEKTVMEVNVGGSIRKEARSVALGKLIG